MGSLRVPKSVARELPFKTKEKKTLKEQEKALFKAENKLVKVVSTEKEREARFLVQRLKLIEKEKDKEKRTRAIAKRSWKQKWEDGMNRNLLLKKKQKNKDKQREKGMKRMRQEERGKSER